MKAAFLFVFFYCYHIALFCQTVPSIEQQRFITQLHAAAPQSSLIHHQTSNTKGLNDFIQTSSGIVTLIRYFFLNTVRANTIHTLAN
ncbi:MAG: hypothetical protein JWP81_4366 [Ferruginibacter sp.]|nr:hypothetical protein [Ferruginibacter sp.]